MRAPGYLGCAALVVTLGGAEAGAQERPLDLAGLVARLDLTEKGAKRWLEQLGVRGDSTATERLLAVSASSGASLLTREGGDSSVRIDPELDTLLLRPETGIVLVHNHPANVGLSSNDLRQLTKPGVLAVVAIGHEGSVFVAAAGPRFDREFFHERQYEGARAEVLKKLRAEWPSSSLPVAVSDAHFSHLVTQSLSRAGIVRYWFRLRGAGRESYEKARVVFARVIFGAAGRLKNR